MSYPVELIPQSNYLLLTDVGELSDRSLIRWSSKNLGDFFDPVTGDVQVGIVEPIRKLAKDLSTSLLGDFTPQHFRYQVSVPMGTPRHNYLVMELWPEGEHVDEPITDQEWQTVDLGVVYHFAIRSIHNYPFEFQSGTDKFNAKLIVKHTPCRSNYWHYSIRVIDNDGVDVADRYADNPRKSLKNRDDRILKAALKSIRQLIDVELPDFGPMPAEVYQVG